MSESFATPALQVGGTLVPGRHVYIARPEDQQVLELLQAHEYCNILTSRQMGKSSLIAHVARIIDQRNIRVAQVDLQDLGTPQSLDDWYQGLLTEIARDLEVRVDVRQWWSSSEWPTPNQRLIAFFREIIAVQIAQPIVVFVDEIDQTLKLNYTDDFFAAIRSMYNQRGKEPAFSRFTFCLVGVASPNELIKDKRTTPYNIGRTIELRDFDPERDDLSELYRAVCPADPARGQEIVSAMIKWTGGHPYLTASLCSRFLRQATPAGEGAPVGVDEWVQLEFVGYDVMPEDDRVHFVRVTEYLIERASDPISTLQLYRRILRGRAEPDRSNQQQHIDLKLSGVVKRDRKELVVRNRIYERIFTDEWARAAMPAAERRVKFARRAAGISLVALCLLGVVAAWQWNRNLNQQAETGVVAVMNAASDRVQGQIEAIAAVRERAIPRFRQAMLDPSNDDRQRLHAALALGMLDEVPYEFLLNAIAAAASGEVDNIVAVFRLVGETVLPKIAQRFKDAKDSDEQVRLATLALHLGDYGPVRTLSALGADPTRRTAFILGFRAWHGDLSDLVPLLRDLDISREDEADFRSAVCSARGLVPVTDSQPVPTEFLEILKAWFLEAPDGGTHSAADWALRQHGFDEEELLKLAKSAFPDAAGLRDWQVNHLNMTMLRIPGREFAMGRVDDDENPSEKDPSEKFEPFWMSDREVSVGQFYSVLKDRNEQADTANPQLPMSYVSWYDAVEFCNELSRTSDGLVPYYRLANIKRNENGSITSAEVTGAMGNGFRLPTEKECEYACRALSTTDHSFGRDDTLLSEFAVFSQGTAKNCGTKLPNGWGLFGMHGNLWEWCGGINDSHSRVLRGGSFFSNDPQYLRSAYRSDFSPESRSDFIGFRISRTP